MSPQLFARFAACTRVAFAASSPVPRYTKFISRSGHLSADILSQLSTRRLLKSDLITPPPHFGLGFINGLEGASVSANGRRSHVVAAMKHQGNKAKRFSGASHGRYRHGRNAGRRAESIATVSEFENGVRNFTDDTSTAGGELPTGAHQMSRTAGGSTLGGERVQGRFLHNGNHPSLARSLHSAVSDDESDDSDEYTLEKEELKAKAKARVSDLARKKRAVASYEVESEDDASAPSSGTVRKRRASSSKEMPIDSDTSLGTARKRRSTASKEKETESDFGSLGGKKERRQAVPSKEENSDSESLEDTDSSLSHLTETRFDKFQISPLSIKALHTVLKYERMTAVQEATFPVILTGKDVLAKARTGTGKTIAFLLPAIELILKASRGEPGNSIYAVIVCPTRELAQQAAAEAEVLLQFHNSFGAQVVFGGTPMKREQQQLRSRPCQILVGTPGRLVDHIQNTPGLTNQLQSVKLFVLDEADHMLDMGFRDSLSKIMRGLPSKRQTLLFSATIPQEVHGMAKVALRPDHSFIDTVGKNSDDTHAKVKQQCIVVPLEKQLTVVCSMLKEHMKDDPNYKVLVFCTTARITAFMAKLYKDLGFNSREIHSRKDQSYRTRISDEFRKSKGGIILFTSDVSARGVDYPNVTLVVQVGAPSELEQYIHRLGRTGRAGKKGEGLLVLAPWEGFFWQKLQKLPITKVPAPEVDARLENKIFTALSEIDPKIRTMAYQAWIGYYKSLKGLALDKQTLVHHANQFSFSMGFKQPPQLSRQLVSKMGFAGVPGLRIG